MFNFLNPSFLFLLPLSAIPFLIHFLNRRRADKIYFSSLVFLKGLEKTRLRKIQLKQLLLLLVRTLVILAAVMAFARPAWQPAGAERRGGRTSAILALDNGYRAGELTKEGVVWDRAKEAGQEVLSLLKDGDEVNLLLTSQPDVEAGFKHDLGAEEEKLEKVEVSVYPGAVFPLLEKAHGLVSASHNPNREIFLLSDGRFPVGRVASASEKKGKLFWLKPNLEESDNRALISFRFADPVLAPNLRLRVEAEVFNQKKSTASAVLVCLFLDGKKVSQKAVDLSALESKKVLLEGTVFSSGWHSGYLDLPDDDLLTDNRLYFSFYLRPKLRVLLAAESPGYWDGAELALNTKGSPESWFETERAKISLLSRLDWSKFDAALVALPEKFDFGWWERILRFASGGGGVLLAPESGLETYPASVLEQSAGLRVEKNLSAGSDAFYSFRPEVSHPLFSFASGTKSLPVLKFYSYYQAKTASEATVLARFAGGGSALVEKKASKGKILFSTAGLNRQNTDLYFHAFAVPFFFRTAQYLAQSSQAPSDYKVGERVFFSPPIFPKRFPLRLLPPDSSASEISLSGKREGYLDLGILNQPGIYRLYDDSAVVGLAAVNVDARNSTLPPLTAEQLEQALPGFEVKEIPLGEKIEPIVRQSRTGRELWKLLVFVCLGLLACEMAVVRWGEKSVAAPTE